jgi:hypothetical protein
VMSTTLFPIEGMSVPSVAPTRNRPALVYSGIPTKHTGPLKAILAFPATLCRASEEALSPASEIYLTRRPD